MWLPNRRGAGSGLAKGDWGLVGQKLLTLWTGPIDLSVSVAQSNRMCSRGPELAASLAVQGGAGCVVPLSGSHTP